MAAATTQPAEGSLLSIPIDRFFAGDRTMDVLFEPSASESLEEDRGTKNFLVLSILDARAIGDGTWSSQDGSWINRGAEKGLGMESVSLSAVEADHSDDLWVPQPQERVPEPWWSGGLVG
eukprot:Skav219549  [mRNA]  locus=scaffold8171:3152:4911:+ [translate_table: standard]